MSKHRYSTNKQIETAAAMLGLRTEAILRHAGLAARFLDSPDATVTPAQYFAIWAAADDLIEGSDKGVLLGRKMPHLPFGSALIAFSCADTIRTGLKRLAIFKPLIAPIRVAQEELPEGYRVRFVPLDDDLAFSTLHATFEIAFFIELCRLLTGRDIAPRAASVAAPTRELEDYLGCSVKPGKLPEILFRHADIDLPLISENADVWKGLEPILTKKMLDRDLTARTADRVRGELMELLPSGRSSIDDVCARLGMGRRNLQRVLGEEGTSFRTVLDGLRQDLALSYLRDEAMRVEEVSYLLAFSDPNSFYRAFRDWTGMTPAEARNLH